LFDESTFYIYTESWHISPTDPGYYTLYVECSGFDVETLTDSMTVYVSESQVESTLPGFLLFIVAVIVICAVVISWMRRQRTVDYSQVEIVTPSPTGYNICVLLN